MLRLLRLCSPSAQVKAAVAHLRRPKRNQQKGKLNLSLGLLALKIVKVDNIHGIESVLAGMTDDNGFVHSWGFSARFPSYYLEPKGLDLSTTPYAHMNLKGVRWRIRDCNLVPGNDRGWL